MVATQSQELWGGKFALAVRTLGLPTAAAVDAAFDQGALVRTWPFRGTLHIVAATEVEWLLSVATARIIRATAPRHRELGLEADDLTRAERVARNVLAGGGLARAEMFAAFNAAGIETAAQRGAHLLLALAVRGVAHWGAVVPSPSGSATQQLFTLNDVLPTQRPTPADPAAELFRRYIRGHGPASAADFAWWTGITVTAARAAAAASGVPQLADELYGTLAEEVACSPVRALGSFDEYYLSYRDRSVVADEAVRAAVGPGKNGMVHPILVRNGRVVGTWHRSGTVHLTERTVAEHEVRTALAVFSAHSGAVPALGGEGDDE